MVSQIRTRSLKVIEESRTQKLQENLIQIAQGEDIGFVYGKGEYKPEIQKLYEEPGECGTRLMEYKECFEIMRKGHDSYSKTDMETTFMWTRVPYKYPEWRGDSETSSPFGPNRGTFWGYQGEWKLPAL